MDDIKHLRDSILRIALRGQEGHIPSSLSILDIVWAIYDGGFVAQDSESKFVLSKGHGCLALYAVLAEKGWFPESWLDHFASFSSPLGGHPDRTQVPGIQASTGSLGHGMPFAAGLSYSMRISKSPGKVYVLVGDGEANEGSIWEAALIANQHELKNLVCIIDDNQSSTRAISLGSVGEKFASFGWTVSEVNGHSRPEITSALAKATTGPHAIVAQTIKGFGYEEMENNPAWHHTKISVDEFRKLVEN